MHSLGKTLLAFPLLHFVLQSQICLLLQVSFDFLLLHLALSDEEDIFFGVLEGLVGLHGTVQLQLLQHYRLGHRQTWITVILNVLPWKRTEIILSFLRLLPSTAFQTLLFTMLATPFLLRDYGPQE